MNEFIELTRPSGKKISFRKSSIVTFENRCIGLNRHTYFEYDVLETYDEIKKLLEN